MRDAVDGSLDVEALRDVGLDERETAAT